MHSTEAASTPDIWQPRLRSEIHPPVEILYQYIRLFSSQDRLPQAWHVLRWLHSAYGVATAKESRSKKSGSVASLKECIEKGWLFVSRGPSAALMNSKNI